MPLPLDDTKIYSSSAHLYEREREVTQASTQPRVPCWFEVGRVCQGMGLKGAKKLKGENTGILGVREM